ncbi:hypothetical protein HG535_0E00790 [Zygotorulaspora mrakii]|uniref:FAD/NAD(P)-binding domain-containing protein n=1 Tax=Zygotorulaspora mrakii TaxID=42260 RepID=A0A7H9B2V2_ZYGMR|nr:uncharacterized protein HG535_0E00790 [Zygotorulaspora mrakii]QLG72995.1 hypothetical protein HG535_0E00790 [Zygotorulaspora mrakii]
MPKRLAIVGAGPGGLATARVFLANFPGIKINLFESDYSVGGIWHYPEADNDHRVMYDHLETNITKYLMRFSGFPFPDDVPLYPWRQNVYDYLISYYEKFIKPSQNFNVHLNSRVVELTKGDNEWTLVSRNTETNEETTLKFDFIVLANGHFSVPNVPVDKVPGLSEWIDHGAAVHSKVFKNCKFARDKTVVVVGNGSSGQDIVNQLASVAKKVYRSVTDVKSDLIPDDFPTPDVVETVPKIESTDYARRTVKLQDGRILENVDNLIYATGFYYSAPFLQGSIKAQLDRQTDKEQSTRFYNLWKQIIFVKDPTLAFSLLPQSVVPFPLAESQAAIMVKVFSGQLKVPNQSDDELEPEFLATLPNYHNLADLKDLDYYDELQSILDQTGGEKDPFKPVKWTDKDKLNREKCVEDKKKRNIYLSKLSSDSRAQKIPYILKQFDL